MAIPSMREAIVPRRDFYVFSEDYWKINTRTRPLYQKQLRPVKPNLCTARPKTLP